MSEISLDPEGVTSLAAGLDSCPHCARAVEHAWVVCAWCGRRLASSAELRDGTPLLDGRFVVRRVLGRGGFGITYAADDTRLRRRVAVKELFPDPVMRHGRAVLPPAHAIEAFRAAKARFLREAAVLARFNHPGIVRVYEVFEEHGTAYLVMELVEGRTLADLLERRGEPFSEREVLDVAARVAGALTEVHDAGVLHRDLNPSNVMATSGGRLVVIDFGLAHTFAADRTGAMTRVVTPGYAPPEQYLGEARFGPPTDVYGLAATLYRLLTGRAPVSALDRQGGTPIPPPHRVNQRASRLVSDGVLDGLELNAAHRPQTMAAFVARLGVADVPVSPRSLVVAIPESGDPGERGDPERAPLAPVAPPDRDATIASRTQVRPDSPPVFAPISDQVPVRRRDARDARDAHAALVALDDPLAAWQVSVPLVVATAALASAAPVLVPFALALFVLPALATAGDAIDFVRGRREGDRLRLRHRAALPPFVPVRFVRNVCAGLVAGAPALLLAGIAVAGVLVLEAAGVDRSTRELVLRPVGAAVALLLAVPVLRDRLEFKAWLVADAGASHLVDRAGGLTRAGRVLWLVAGLVTVAGLAFHPELWPIR